MTSSLDNLLFLRNRNPHWRLTGSAYFVTWRILAGTPDLTDAERALVFDCLKHFHKDRYRLFACVVMNDHVHVIVQPLGDNELSKIVHSWKSFAANRMQREHGRRGSVWQKDYYERIVRGEEELYEKSSYIVNNPLKRWPALTEYRWVEWFEF